MGSCFVVRFDCEPEPVGPELTGLTISVDRYGRVRGCTMEELTAADQVTFTIGPGATLSSAYQGALFCICHLVPLSRRRVVVADGVQVPAGYLFLHESWDTRPPPADCDRHLPHIRRIVVSSPEDVEKLLQRHSEHHGCETTLQIDLSAISEVSSRMLSSIVYYHDKFAASGGRLQLMNAPAGLQKMLDTLGFGIDTEHPQS